MKLYTASGIREIKEKFGFRLSKSLGQNFLVDKNIRDKIVEGSLIAPDDLVIEIGPGAGVLTQALSGAAAKVVAVELDQNLIPILSETLAECGNVEIIQGDVLKVDLPGIIRDHQAGGKVRFVGNLPYYITTPIIMKILEDKIPADSITVMIQKEVADRIAAKPGTKAYGALTVAVNLYCQVSRVVSAPKEAFYPRPQVDSAVIRLDIRKEMPVSITDEKIFFAVVKAAFGQRRKTLANAMTGLMGMDKPEIGELLGTAGIDSMRRGETLDLAEFARIANLISKEEHE